MGPITELVDGVYDITCYETSDGKRYRSFLINKETPTLFDTGLESSVETLCRRIDTIGIEPERLIITHGDPDHIGGFDEVVSRYQLENWVPEQTTTQTDTSPDNRYSHGDRIGPFKAVHVPGHEPDNYALVDEQAGIAVMGDSVSGADQRGLPAGYFLLPPAAVSVDLNAAEENLEQLLGYEFEVALVFHGSSVLEHASSKLERFVNYPGK
jgi:glyoxylase-like metal-dependent hydrolase (beta-lactamase superfamily II)